MQINFNLDIRNGRLQQIVNGIDSGPGAGRIILYTNPKPLPGQNIDISVNTIAIVQLVRPCGIINDGHLQFVYDSQFPIIALSNGQIAWGRIINSIGVFQVDMDASVLSGNGAIKLDEVIQEQGNLIVPISMVFSEP